jgi:PAS domain S-box-containing protein
MNPTILYVDDQQENLDGFRFTFRKEYIIHTALNAAEGFKILEENEISIVISDQRMPDILGTEFLNQIAQKFPHSIRIILTAFADFDAVVGAINKGQVYRFLTKPWNRDEMRMTIENAHEAYLLRKENFKLIRDLREANENLNANNILLQMEIEERKVIEKELHNHKDNLEIIVKDRTKELAASNEELGVINEELQEVNERLSMEIEQRKAIQQSLEESEKKFRSFVEQSSQGTSLIDRNGKILEWNHSMETILGNKKDDVLNRPVWESEVMMHIQRLQSDWSYKTIKDDMLQYIRNIDNAKPLDIEGEIKDEHGNKRFVLLTLFPILTDTMAYVGAFVSDMTQRRQAEEEILNQATALEELNAEYQSLNEELNTYNEELKTVNESLRIEIERRTQTEKLLAESETKFRSFIEQSAEGIIIATTDGKIIEVNQSALEIFNIPKEQLIQGNVWNIQSRFLPENSRNEDAVNRMRKFIDDYFQKEDPGKSYVMEGYYDQEKENIRFIQGNLFKIKSRDQQYIGLTARDLTEKKKSEEELRKHRDHLEELVELRTRELLTTEARLLTLSDNLPGGAIFRGFTDQQGLDHMVYASKGIKEITGLTIEQLKENMVPFFERIHPEDVSAFLEAKTISQNSISTLDIVFRYKRVEDTIQWIQLRTIYSKTTDETVWWDGYAIDITERREAEEQAKERDIVFKNLQELIAPVTGEKLFDTLLLNIEEILHTYSLFVAEFIPETGKLRTLSFSREREIHNNFEYSVTNTPSAKILSDGLVAYNRNIIQAFPKDYSLVEERIDGYVGVALTDSNGKSIGVVVAASRSEIPNLDFAIQILRVFSVRIGAELLRIQKDRELKEREERFSTLFDLSPNMQIITGMDGKIIEANSTFFQYTGLTREETIGSSTVGLKLWDKEDSARLDEEFRKNGRLTNFAGYFIPKKGKKRHVLLSQAPITIKGEPYAISTGVDITERILAEQKLTESEERFRSILQNLSDSIWIVDTNTVILYESPSAVNMLGYKEGELKGRKGLELVHPEDVPEVVHEFNKAVYNNESGTPTLFRVITAAGNYIYVEAISNNQIEHPAIKGIIITLRNVTERIVKDKALRESEQKFRNIFNNSTDAIIISSPDQRILEVNEVVINLSGFTRDELLTKRTMDLATEKSKQDINARFSQIAIEETIPPIEVDFTVRSGDIITTEMTSRLIDYEGGKALLTLIRDITERKKLEKILIDTIIQTEEKERERMAADLHDEVGPLLSSMKMYLNSLVETRDTTKSLYIADQLQLLIKESINAVREISNDLSPHILNNYGLSAAVRATVEAQMQFIHIKLTENLENRRYSPNIEIIFYRIIRELINNTIKHASAKKIDIRMYHREEKMILYYSDNGTGFDWQMMMNSTRKGLGLMNILSRVKSMNGHYSIQTSPGKGFYFELTSPL